MQFCFLYQVYQLLSSVAFSVMLGHINLHMFIMATLSVTQLFTTSILFPGLVNNVVSAIQLVPIHLNFPTGTELGKRLNMTLAFIPVTILC